MERGLFLTLTHFQPHHGVRISGPTRESCRTLQFNAVWSRLSTYLKQLFLTCKMHFSWSIWTSFRLTLFFCKLLKSCLNHTPDINGNYTHRAWEYFHLVNPCLECVLFKGSSCVSKCDAKRSWQSACMWEKFVLQWAHACGLKETVISRMSVIRKLPGTEVKVMQQLEDEIN